MFEPLRRYGVQLRSETDWPTRDTLQALVAQRGVVTAGGVPLRLVGESGREPYEARIRLAGEMHVRERDWHDLFNTLVWLTYPGAKAALNDAQYAALRLERASAGPPPSARSPRRDALTLFDENGAIVVSHDATLLDDLRSFRWHRLFWERRDEVKSGLRVFIFGHALFEKALRPYVGMTAHAILLPVREDFLAMALQDQTEALDSLGSCAVSGITAAGLLSPLPVLGMPGWWAENERPAFYANADYFRAGRRKG